LDLASRLRPAPRGLDALFYVNVGAVALFFVLFGSRFVLAPGLAVDFALPQVTGAGVATRITDLVIAVPASDMAVVDGAVLDFNALGAWMKVRSEGGGAEGGRLRLLVQASASLPARDITTIYALAAEAGFSGVLIATDRPAE
jgi:biopolymer transport protein ExbD